MSDETIGTPRVPETPREPATPVPASNGGGSPAPPPSRPAPEVAGPEAGSGSGESGTGDNGQGSGAPRADGSPRPDGAPRKRRRGSRGGKNRKRPTGTGAAQTGSGRPDGEGARSADERSGDARPAAAGERNGGARPPREAGDRRNERAGADRGLTTEDVAAEARNEAGLQAPDAADVVKPRIGDSRPAPAAGAATPGDRPDGGNRAPGDGGPRKRRRRGGRGRSRSGGGGGDRGRGPAR